MADRILGSTVIIISLILLYSLRDATVEAYVFPAFFLVILIIFYLILIIKPSEDKIKFQNLKDLGLQVVLIILYINVLPYVGFIISTLIFLFSSIHFSGYKNWRKNLLVTVIVTVLLYIVFNYYLQVRLP